MAGVSSHSDLLLLEADFLQAQSEIVLGLSNDIHFAAKVLNFRVYDIESRVFRLRKAAWETRSKSGCGGHMLADIQNEEDECRLNGVLKNATTLIESAQQVKIELKALIEVLSGRQEMVQTSTPSKEWTENGIKNIEHEEIQVLKADLPSLEESLTKELPFPKPVFVDSSGFVPLNFRAVSSKTPSEGPFQSDKISQPHYVKKVRFADEEEMMTPRNSISKLESSNHIRRGRSKARGRKVRRFSHVEPRRGPAVSVEDRLHGVGDRSRSPASSRGTEKEEDLLGWIPKKVDIARLPVDEGLRSLMMCEMQRKRQDRAE